MILINISPALLESTGNRLNPEDTGEDLKIFLKEKKVISADAAVSLGYRFCVYIL